MNKLFTVTKTSALLFICALSLPATAGAAIRITEIMYDPDGADAKHEWVEIYNTGSDAVDLSKYKFSDTSAHVLNAPPKNGGTGSLVIPAGSFAVLASDAATFSLEYPGRALVIDTAMNLRNSGSTILLTNGTTLVDSATYAKSEGAAGNGNSLQLNGTTWIHAKPTPGEANATLPSVTIAPIVASKTVKIQKAQKVQKVQKLQAEPKQKLSQKKSRQKKPIAISEAEAAANDPVAVVNVTSTEVVAQTAAAGSLGGSYWWIAAAALAITVAATATIMSRSKKQEWDIEEIE